MKKQANVSAPASTRPLTCHLFLFGGSAPIMAQGWIFMLMSGLVGTNRRVNLKIRAADFDSQSDSLEQLKHCVEAFGPIINRLHNQQDTNELFCNLHSLSMEEIETLHTENYNQTLLEYTLSRGQAQDAAALQQALGLLFTPEMYHKELGSGAYGSESLGWLCSCLHREKIKSMFQAALHDAKSDPGSEHVFVILTSTCGATGLSITPVFLDLCKEAKENGDLSENMKIFAQFDGGTFAPHSMASVSENARKEYFGDANVTQKSSAILKHWDCTERLKVLDGAVVMRPLTPSGTSHQLCEVLSLEHAQYRHSSIEVLLGCCEVMKHILGQQNDQLNNNRLAELLRKDDCPDHPLSLSDLNLDANAFHRAIRMLVMGAISDTLVWKQDQACAVNIPAVRQLVNSGEDPANICEKGGAISRACMLMLQQVYDWAVTGSNFEAYRSPNFSVEDNFRIVNIPFISQVLAGEVKNNSHVCEAGSVKEFVTVNRKGKLSERKVMYTGRKSGITLKQALENETVAIGTVQDIFIRLFYAVQ